MKGNSNSPGSNGNILILTYLISAVFVLLIGYLVWFIEARSENALNNSYNARLEHLSDKVIRGKNLKQ